MAGTVDNIRNLVFVGHGAVGKTMLAEAMLHAAGAVTRAGTIDQGNTVCDFDEIEKERKHSVDCAIAHFTYKATSINVIDTPGYPDFVGQALCGLGGADLAVVTVSAMTGIEVNTRRMMAAADEFGLPTMIVINKIDAENIDLGNLVAGLRDAFGKRLLELNLPADNGTAVLAPLDDQADGRPDFGDLGSAKLALTEAVIESDEALMERYLAGEEIGKEELVKAMKAAVVARTLVPILFTAAEKEVGVGELLDTIVRICPSPAEAPARKLVTGEGEQMRETEIAADPAGPVVGLVFKIYSDQRSNIRYAVVRMLSGTIKPDSTFHIDLEKKGIRAGHLYRVNGQEMIDVDQAAAGEIFSVARIDELQIAHTIQVGLPGKLAMPAQPVPMYALAIEPKSRGDEQKISGALARLSEEDTTFKVERDRQTNELVIAGTGDLHLRVILEKIARRFKLEVNTKLPKIPYRETITINAEGHYRHKKQTGGAGQFGEVYLKVEPMARDEGFEFVDDIFGGAIPQQFLPAVEKGVRDLMDEGVIAGFPMQDVRVRVYDGKHHPVDSKEIAFRIAGKYAVKDAIVKAKPTLLEPVVNIEVTIPDRFVGDITGDLSGRRGRIVGQDVLPGGIAQIKAQVPLAELAQYNSQLRSVTGGQGSYTMEFSHYNPVPPNVQQEIVKQYRPKQDDVDK